MNKIDDFPKSHMKRSVAFYSKEELKERKDAKTTEKFFLTPKEYRDQKILLIGKNTLS